MEFFSLFSRQWSTQRQTNAQTGNKQSKKTTSSTIRLIHLLHYALYKSKGYNQDSVHSQSLQFEKQFRFLWSKLQEVAEIGFPILSFGVCKWARASRKGSHTGCKKAGHFVSGQICCTCDRLFLLTLQLHAVMSTSSLRRRNNCLRSH